MVKTLMVLMLLLSSLKGFSQSIADSTYDSVFTKVATEQAVPERLLRAICWSESKFDPQAFVEGDGSGDNHAFGICQILYTTASEQGFKQSKCISHDFTLRSARTVKACKLFDSYTNVTMAAKYLKEKMVKYGDSWVSSIAAYNAGSVRICKTGTVYRAKDHEPLWKCKKGGLLNQKYVDDVVKALQEQAATTGVYNEFSDTGLTH